MSGVADRCQKVGEGLIGSSGIAGGVEVHEEPADNGQYDRGQLGSAQAAHAILQGREPIGGRAPTEAGPEGFTRRVVQSAEHPKVRLALRSGDRRPGAGQGGRIGLVGS